MIPRRLLIALPVLLLACRGRDTAVASTSNAGSAVRALLSAGTHRAERLALWAPPRLNELTQKLGQAAQANAAWFQQYIQQATPGQPLPYDRRLGLTEPEYQEYLRLGDSLEMRPADTITVVIESRLEGWRFGDSTTATELRGIIIDTIRNHVETRLGIIPGSDPVTPSAAQHATGQWGGPHWKLEQVDDQSITGTVAEFSVGRLEATGQTLIYYDARRAINGQMVEQEKVVLRLIR